MLEYQQGGYNTSFQPITAKVLLLGDANVGKTSLRSQFIHHRFSSAYRATVGGDFLTAKVHSSAYKQQLAAASLANGDEDSNQIDDRLASARVSHSSAKNIPTRGSHAHSSSTSSISDKPLVFHRHSNSYSSIDNNSQTVLLQIWDTAGQERFNSLVRSFYRGSDVAVLVYDVTNASSFSHLSKWSDDFMENSQVANPIIIVVGNKIDRSDYRTVSARQAREFAQKLTDTYNLRPPPFSPYSENSFGTGGPSLKKSSSLSNASGSPGNSSPGGELLSSVPSNMSPTPYFSVKSSHIPQFPSATSLRQPQSRYNNTSSSPNAFHDEGQLKAYSSSSSILNNPNRSSNTNSSHVASPQLGPLSSSSTSRQLRETSSITSLYQGHQLQSQSLREFQQKNPAIQCFEVSAKDNIEVDKLFTYVADRILAARRDVILDFDSVDSSTYGGPKPLDGGMIDISDSKNSKQKKGSGGICC